ncbi:MAG: hypothetical protein AMXMBFR81_29290 [Chthonomonas sp.]
MKPILAFIAAVALVSIGCKGGGGSGYTPAPVPKVEPAKVEPGNEAVLLPAAVGNKWVFEIEGETSVSGNRMLTRATATYEISGVKDTPRGKEITFKVTTKGVDNSVRTSEQMWLMDAKGIYQVNGGQNKLQYDPPQPLALFPATAGDPVSFKGTGPVATGLRGSFSGKVQCNGNEEVDTGKGRLGGIAFASQGDWSGPDSAGKTVTGKFGMVVWFAPNVGLVRVRQELSGPNAGAFQTLRLIDYEVKS